MLYKAIQASVSRMSIFKEGSAGPAHLRKLRDLPARLFDAFELVRELNEVAAGFGKHDLGSGPGCPGLDRAVRDRASKHVKKLEGEIERRLGW